MSSLGDVFSLVRRWSRRDQRTIHARRHWQSRDGYGSAVWNTQRQGKRRNTGHDFETTGALYSVKFLGVYAVDSPYDELGCHRALSKQERSHHHHHSTRVILSLTSTTIKIIHKHWFAFEHAVTAVSTCYTDQNRPRLFAYIMKNYTSGNHFCMAFKTPKKSDLTGEELQRVFGYAFDSCCNVSSSLLLSSEEDFSLVDGESEFERCQQICHSSCQFSHIMRTDSNFSAMLKMTVRNVGPKNYTVGHAPHAPRRAGRNCTTTEGDDFLSICYVDDNATCRQASKITPTKSKRMHNRVEKQVTGTVKAHKGKNLPTIPKCTKAEQEELEQQQEEKEKERVPKLSKPTLKSCFVCQCQQDSALPLDRSLSDSFLQCFMHNYHLSSNMEDKTQTKADATAEREAEESSNAVKIGAMAKEGPLEDGATSLQSMVEVNASELKKETDNVVLPTDEDYENGTKEGNEVSGHDSLAMDLSQNSLELSEAIERQTAYTYLPGGDSGDNQLPPHTNSTNNSELSITSSENLVGSVAESFVAELTLTLNQLFDSLKEQPSTLHSLPTCSDYGRDDKSSSCTSQQFSNTVVANSRNQREPSATTNSDESFIPVHSSTATNSIINNKQPRLLTNLPSTNSAAPTPSNTLPPTSSTSPSPESTGGTMSANDETNYKATSSTDTAEDIIRESNNSGRVSRLVDVSKNCSHCEATHKSQLLSRVLAFVSSQLIGSDDDKDDSSSKSTSTTANEQPFTSSKVSVKTLQAQLSQVLEELMSSPHTGGSVRSESGAGEDGDQVSRSKKTTALTCLIATWEHA